MKHGSLFSGIGGFDLAAQWMGWDNVFHCEWNHFGQRVLKYHFPNATGHGDITKTDFTIYRGQCDILTGGFPCQPFSAAGKQGGVEDDRHLWPEMRRAIREIQPGIVVAENVAGLFTVLEPASLSEVETKEIQLFSENEDYQINSTIQRLQRRVIATIIEEIRAEGYDLPRLADGTPVVCCIPACAVNAPHRRDRVWFVAYRNGAGLQAQRPKQQAAGIEQYGELCRLTQNTNGNGWNGEQREGKPGKREQWNLSAGNNEPIPTNDAEAGPTTHPDSNGQFWSNSQHEVNPSEGRQYAQRDPQPGNGNGDATHTNGIGLRGEGNRAGKSRFIGQNEPGNYWQDFPTQSPICGGDDGLPSELDGITFSKWRNESIKAYGNAIVPQVALQIFQAIQKINFAV